MMKISIKEYMISNKQEIKLYHLILQQYTAGLKVQNRNSCTIYIDDNA